MRPGLTSPAERRGKAGIVRDHFGRIIRWSGSRIRSVPAAGAVVLIGLAVAMAAAGLFALVAQGVASGLTQPLDQAAVAWARGRTATWLDWLAMAGAVLGSGAMTWVALGAGTVMFLRMRHIPSLVLLWISLLGARFLNAELKTFFARPRPKPIAWDLEVFGRPIDFPTSPSFPSGHAVSSVAIFGTLAYLLGRLEPSIRTRRITVAAAVGIILLIGLSRIYLGVHYPSDVLAGYLAGSVWVAFTALVSEIVGCHSPPNGRDGHRRGS